MFRRLANLIDYAERADGPPPTMLWPFMAWCTKGTWPVILLAALASGIAGFFEMASASFWDGLWMPQPTAQDRGFSSKTCPF